MSFHTPPHKQRAVPAPVVAAKPDFIARHHGAVIILTAQSRPAKAWTRERLGVAGLRFGAGYVISPRFWQPVADGIDEAGLTVDVR